MFGCDGGFSHFSLLRRYPDKSAKDNSANDTSAKPTVRMPTVRKGQQCECQQCEWRQRCECQQCECDSSAKDDSPNCAKPFPQLRQLDLDFRQAFLSFFTHLLHTRDRRLASEIPLKLSTLVAVDRLTFFRQRSEKVHESTEKTTSAKNRILSVETDKLEPWATSPSSSLDRPLPSLRHRALLGK